MDKGQMTNSTDLTHDATLVLVSISLFVHAPVEIDQRVDVLERVARKLRDAAQQVVATDAAVEAVGVTSYRYPGDEDENARRCSCCGRWATDRNLPQVIDGLPDGYEVEGIFRCDQCHEQECDSPLATRKPNEAGLAALRKIAEMKKGMAESDPSQTDRIIREGRDGAMYKEQSCSNER